MVPLNYNQLYYFFKIAEQGSISLASKKLLISSPALSMQLKELEESLGCLLFDRVGKKMILTESGSIVYEYAKDIFKLGHELIDTVADGNKNNQRMKIEIGCQDTIAKNIVDELLLSLIQEKKCKVVLKEGSREELIKLQNEYKLDLILTNSVPSVDNSYIYETKMVLKESLIIAGHPKYKSVKSKFSELSKIPFVLPTYDSSLRLKIDDYFFRNKINLDIVAEVQDKATEVDLALKGIGLIVAAKSNIKDYLKDKSLVELHPLKSIQEEIWMIMSKRKILNPLAIWAMKNFTFHP